MFQSSAELSSLPRESYVELANLRYLGYARHKGLLTYPTVSLIPNGSGHSEQSELMADLN